MLRLRLGILAIIAAVSVANTGMASISLAEVRIHVDDLSTNSHMHIVGTSRDRHSVEARMQSFDSVTPSGVRFVSGFSIGMYLPFENMRNDGLIVDGISYDTAWISPVIDGPFEWLQPDSIDISGFGVAPTPADRSQRETATVMVPFTFTGFAFGASLEIPYGVGSAPSSNPVDQLFKFVVSDGTGVAEAVLDWYPSSPTTGEWELTSVVYRFEAAPEPSTIAVWSMLVGIGMACTSLKSSLARSGTQAG